MKNLFLFIFAITTLKAAGQDHLVGVKTGVTWSDITSSNFFSQTDHRAGVVTGLTYEYILTKHFSVGADLIYDQRGFTHDMTVIVGNNNNLGIQFPIVQTIKFNYRCRLRQG